MKTRGSVKVKVLPGGAATEIEEAVRDYLIDVGARTRNPRTREFYARSLEKNLIPFCRAQNADSGLMPRASPCVA